jgi:aquaporin related protein
MIAQIIAGIAAAGMTSLLFPGPMRVDLSLGGGTSISQGLFIEMFTTILLVFTVVMLAAVKHKATFLAPLGIGLALFVDHLTGEYCHIAAGCADLLIFSQPSTSLEPA